VALQRTRRRKKKSDGCKSFAIGGSLGTAFKADKLGDAGGRCLRHSPVHLASVIKCNVEGCTTNKQGTLLEDDEFGVRGFRCIYHNAPVKRCNVTGCTNHVQGRAVTQDDEHGPAGKRCRRHGAVCKPKPNKPTCNVEGCTKWKQGNALEADGLGEAGSRCWKHMKHLCMKPDAGEGGTLASLDAGEGGTLAPLDAGEGGTLAHH